MVFLSVLGGLVMIEVLLSYHITRQKAGSFGFVYFYIFIFSAGIVVFYLFVFCYFHGCGLHSK